MPDLPDELIRTNALLDEYVKIHDSIFKFSWRKALSSIPRLFKATDFGAHVNDLDRLASDLTETSATLKAEPGALEGSHQYTAALLEAIQALRKICRRFHEQSQGNLSTYPMSEYDADLKSYERLVKTSQELGIALNQRFRDTDVLPEG
jgi:hypothetical protein